MIVIPVSVLGLPKRISESMPVTGLAMNMRVRPTTSSFSFQTVDSVFLFSDRQIWDRIQR
jgi:hypothetical protein